MSRFSLFRSLPAILCAFVIASCSDSGVSGPPAPVHGVADGSSGSGSSGSGSSGSGSSGSGSSGSGFHAPGIGDSAIDVTGLELRAAWWKENQRNLVRVSKTIDVSGGTISIPATGLTILFPAGAVVAPTTIRITADEKYVAYKMEPEGTQFLKDVIVTQSLSTTEFGGRPLRSPLFAAYIANDRVQLSGNVPVTELEPSHTIFSSVNSLIPVAHVWIIRHFSRYMLASG
jgi:hypothetical protein